MGGNHNLTKIAEDTEGEEVILTGILAEFHIAVLQEIDAASRSVIMSVGQAKLINDCGNFPLSRVGNYGTILIHSV